MGFASEENSRLQTFQKVYLRTGGGFFLTCVHSLNPSVSEFAFGLEPIVQLAPWLSTTLKIYFMRAKSDFLVTRGVPRNPSSFGLANFGPGTFICL